MNTPEASDAHPTTSRPEHPRPPLTRRKLITLGIVTLASLFWQSLLPYALHIIIYILEILEWLVDEILEILFHLEGYTAQMFTAWIGLTAFIALCVWTYRTIRKRFKRRFHDWDGVGRWLRGWLHRHWESLALVISAFLAGTFLF